MRCTTRPISGHYAILGGLEDTPLLPTLSPTSYAVVVSPQLDHIHHPPEQKQVACKKGSYGPILPTQSLEGPDKIFPQVGSSTSGALNDITFLGTRPTKSLTPGSYSSNMYPLQVPLERLRSHCLGKTHPKTRHRTCMVDSTLSTHPRHTLDLSLTL
jgi:hypothetical protein